jgi:hypothetical protein
MAQGHTVSIWQDQSLKPDCSQPAGARQRLLPAISTPAPLFLTSFPDAISPGANPRYHVSPWSPVMCLDDSHLTGYTSNSCLSLPAPSTVAAQIWDLGQWRLNSALKVRQALCLPVPLGGVSHVQILGCLSTEQPFSWHAH